MAISSQGHNNRRRNRRLMNEINVTPLVDVMLVLLITFMITAPMLVAGIDVDLPKTESAPLSGQFKPLVITIDKSNELYITETKVDPKELIPKLKNITKEKKDTRIFVKGDKSVPYGIIVETMSLIHSAGFTKVALISDIKHK
ncbi:MAG: protein TolR [Rickettsiaceae bacterium]|nr:protein TolR [Rickettsiaceae bacterium]